MSKRTIVRAYRLIMYRNTLRAIAKLRLASLGVKAECRQCRVATIAIRRVLDIGGSTVATFFRCGALDELE